MAVKELTEVMVTGNNHAWKFYAGASGKGKDNDYFFHHAALTHLVDFYVAKRVKDNKPPLTRIDAKTSKSRRSTLSLDKLYRFITWTQDDPIGVDDDDVFFADKSAKWSASPVEGCKSDREYRSGSSHAVDDLRRRAQPCSCSKCRVKDYDNCRHGVDRGPEMRQSDGWTRTTIILKPPSGDDRSSASSPRAWRRRTLVCCPRSEDPQGRCRRATADNQRRVNAWGARWNIKKGEFCLTVRWFDLKPCGYYEDYGSQDERLEMVIAVGDGAARSSPPSEGQGARGPGPVPARQGVRSGHPQRELDKYVDRAAAGSSA
ncbi:hypothetical protein JL721_7634 [Aureococcus anophagefferens]|nr:hypothetical protein JL721_7634 [Aureococcus anophagefferens]